MRRWLRSALVIGFYLLGLFTSLFVGTSWTVVRKAGVLFAGVVLAAAFFYHEHYKPAVTADRRLLGELLNIVIFPRLRQIYRQELAKSAGDELAANELDRIVRDVRINLMVYRRRDLFPWRNDRKLLMWQKSMQIDFFDGDYSRAEKELKWREDEGCCGTALVERDPIAADLCDSDGNEWGLSSKQQEIANDDLKSVLSVPIYRQREGETMSEASREGDAEIVAILNVDSEYCLDETRFDEKSIESALAKPAQYVGLFL